MGWANRGATGIGVLAAAGSVHDVQRRSLHAAAPGRASFSGAARGRACRCSYPVHPAPAGQRGPPDCWWPAATASAGGHDPVRERCCVGDSQYCRLAGRGACGHASGLDGVVRGVDRRLAHCPCPGGGRSCRGCTLVGQRHDSEQIRGKDEQRSVSDWHVAGRAWVLERRCAGPPPAGIAFGGSPGDRGVDRGSSGRRLGCRPLDRGELRRGCAGRGSRLDRLTTGCPSSGLARRGRQAARQPDRLLVPGSAGGKRRRTSRHGCGKRLDRPQARPAIRGTARHQYLPRSPAGSAGRRAHCANTRRRRARQACLCRHHTSRRRQQG